MASVSDLRSNANCFVMAIECELLRPYPPWKGYQPHWPPASLPSLVCWGGGFTFIAYRAQLGRVGGGVGFFNQNSRAIHTSVLSHHVTETPCRLSSLLFPLLSSLLYSLVINSGTFFPPFFPPCFTPYFISLLYSLLYSLVINSGTGSPCKSRGSSSLSSAGPRPSSCRRSLRRMCSIWYCITGCPLAVRALSFLRHRRRSSCAIYVCICMSR